MDTTTPLSTVLENITPLPWKAAYPHDWNKDHGYSEVVDKDGNGAKGPGYSNPICCQYIADSPKQQANLAYILHATALLPELVLALDKALPELQEYIEDLGGCDHSVNICFCSLIQAADDCAAVLAKAKAVLGWPNAAVRHAEDNA